MDDFGLRRLTAQQSQDLHELIIERHRRSSFAFTSNRGVGEWLGLFDDPILGYGALDRVANAAHQVVIFRSLIGYRCVTAKCALRNVAARSSAASPSSSTAA